MPKITLITRKAYGGAYIVMSSKPTGADVNLAYPQAQIAVMGAEGAVNILYRKASAEEKAGIIQEYEEKFNNPYRAAERGYRATPATNWCRPWRWRTTRTRAIRRRSTATCRCKRYGASFYIERLVVEARHAAPLLSFIAFIGLSMKKIPQIFGRIQLFSVPLHRQKREWMTIGM